MKISRKILTALLVPVLALGVFVPLTLSATEVRITINGEEADFSFQAQRPVIVDGRTLVPVESLHEPRLDGIEITMIRETEMVPIRAIFENAGHTVNWDGATNTVQIITSTEAISKEIVAENLMNSLAAGDTPDFQMLLLLRGSLVDFSIASSSNVDGMTVFEVSATHTTGTTTYTVTVDADGQVADFGIGENFNFQAAQAPADATYTVEAIIVGTDTDWPLDGILTMPQSASTDNPVPAIVLVHGSGAQNMDTTIFDNRVFPDIADYLSSNGIAVLRYHKRTFSHGERMAETMDIADLTLREEVIEDALLAAQMLRNDARIGNVFVVGHSLGAMVAPLIAEEGGLDGAILLGGSPRPLFEVQYDQNIDAINNAISAGQIPQDVAEQQLAMVTDLLEEARNMSNLSPDELQTALIFGIPAIYQQSVVNSLPLPFISRNTTPVLIIHGGRDFQVSTENDFQIFVSQTQGLPHVTTRLYEGLNHLFIQSQTDHNDIRDYIPLGNVDTQMLRGIVNWILAQ